MICPRGAFHVERSYLPHSNVLQTTFITESGRACVTDFLPVLTGRDNSGALHPQREIVRIIEGLAGHVDLQILYAPRPNYARDICPLEHRGAMGWACAHGDHLTTLHADFELTPSPDATDLHAELRVRAHQKHYLSLAHVERDIAVVPLLGTAAEYRLEQTLNWWRDWCAGCVYDGPYRDAVLRSALVLKLLTYDLSGAVIAAPTSSLPEKIGGVRNWDYRYCWVRDAAMTLRAFFDLGYRMEGENFFSWLLHATRLSWPKLQILYDVYGETRLPETELTHLEGYRQSRPVRIGNGASHQIQLDVYGEAVLAAHNYLKRGGTLDRYEARLLIGFGHTVCAHWREPDQGIWELRDEARHNTHSKLMCWVALDRLIKLHEMHEMGQGYFPVDRFRREREAIRETIETRCFNAELNSYVDEYDGRDMDASLLLLARYGYIDPCDPRMRATYRRIQNELSRNDLVHRYSQGRDQLPPGEGAFVITSFWAVDYLARCGEVDEATRQFEHLLSFGNDLGLFAEEIDPDTGELLGNYPQAFSHIGLITAALSLAEAKRSIATPEKRANV